MDQLEEPIEDHTDTSPKTNKPCFVYLLEATNKSTYVGATVDLDKRLRQRIEISLFFSFVKLWGLISIFCF